MPNYVSPFEIVQEDGTTYAPFTDYPAEAVVDADNPDYLQDAVDQGVFEEQA